MKSLPLYIVFLLYAFQLSGKDNLETIKAAFYNKNKSDAEKIENLNKIIESYKITPDSSLKYSFLLLDLANKINSEKEIANGYKTIGNAYIFKGNEKEAFRILMEGVVLLKNSPENQKFLVEKLGFIYKRQGKSDQSLEMFGKYLSKAQFNKDEETEAFYLRLLGYTHDNIGNFDKSIEFLHKALKIYSKIKKEIEIIPVYNRLGVIYEEMGNIDMAEKYDLKSREIALKLNHKYYIAISEGNIGAMHSKRGNYEEAISMFNNCIGIMDSLNENSIVSAYYSELGFIYDELGQYEKALEYFGKSLEISTKNLDKYATSLDKFNIGNIYLKQKKYKAAIVNLEEARKLAEGLKDMITMEVMYKGITQAYEEVKDYRKALEYERLYAKIHDSILGEEKIKNINELQTKYEVELKENKILALEKEKSIQQLQLSQKEKEHFYLVAGLIALLLIAASIVFLLLKNIKAKKLLQESKDTIERKNQELVDANNTKDKFFSIIAHDLRSPLNSLQGMVYLLKNGQNGTQMMDLDKILENLGNDLSNVSSLMDNLLQWALKQQNEIKYNPQYFNINIPVEENIQLLKVHAENKGIEILNLIDEDIEVESDLNMIRFIMRNLISNAIKFTPNGGAIYVSVKQEGDEAVLIVKDTGVGLSEEVMHSIFTDELSLSTTGVRGERGTGLGLNLCKEFAKKMGGKMWIKSERNKGSEFYIGIPAKQKFTINATRRSS